MTRKKNIKIGMLVVLLLVAGGLNTAYASGRAEQSRRLERANEQANLLVGFGLTTSSFDSIISAGHPFGWLWRAEWAGNAEVVWWNADDYELTIVWFDDSTEDNFHAALSAINDSGNGNGTAQELRLPSGRILFAQTERWELLWEEAEHDVEDAVGIMGFRIYRLSP